MGTVIRDASLVDKARREVKAMIARIEGVFIQ